MRGWKPPSLIEVRWKTEEAWLTEEIARDLGEMVLFARDGAAAPAAEVEVEVGASDGGGLRVGVELPRAPAVEVTLPASRWAWSPQAFTPLAAGLLQSAGVAAAPASGETLLLPRWTPMPSISRSTTARSPRGCSAPCPIRPRTNRRRSCWERSPCARRRER